MSRLFSQHPPKGIFRVDLQSASRPKPNILPSLVKVDEEALVKVTPNIRSLRIEVEYE